MTNFIFETFNLNFIRPKSLFVVVVPKSIEFLIGLDDY